MSLILYTVYAREPPGQPDSSVGKCAQFWQDMNVLFRATIFMFALLGACDSAGEREAARLCAKARALDATDPQLALETYARMWGSLPTAGTATAGQCIMDVVYRVRRMRVIVKQDKGGEEATISGCEWAVQAVDAFGGLQGNIPFRRYRAEDLLDKCRTPVGRAWTRDPDNSRYLELTGNITRLLGR